MLPWLAIPPALALPVSGDLQVRLHEPALGFTEAQAEGLDPFLSDPDLFENAIDCWDRVGIEDFNLAVPINTVSLSTDDGVFLVSVEFGDLLGTGWTVYSEDSETFDTCPEFESSWIVLPCLGLLHGRPRACGGRGDGFHSGGSEARRSMAPSIRMSHGCPMT